jgi:hypothetical protein
MLHDADDEFGHALPLCRLLDDLIGALKQDGALRLTISSIFADCLDRQISRLLALENSASIVTDRY